MHRYIKNGPNMHKTLHLCKQLEQTLVLVQSLVYVNSTAENPSMVYVAAAVSVRNPVKL